MRKLAHALTIVCLAATAGVYVGAKIDFFRRYDPANPDGYIAGHWPYWLAMGVLIGIAYALARCGAKPRGPAAGGAS